MRRSDHTDPVPFLIEYFDKRWVVYGWPSSNGIALAPLTTWPMEVGVAGG